MDEYKPKLAPACRHRHRAFRSSLAGLSKIEEVLQLVVV